jgi:hypothetical protein
VPNDNYTVDELLIAIDTSTASSGNTEIPGTIKSASVGWHGLVPYVETQPLTVSDLIQGLRGAARDLNIANVQTPIPRDPASLLPGLPPLTPPDLPGVTPPPPPPSLPPVDPVEALNGIARAIQQMERTLNPENLVIADTSVDVELNVRVGDVAGAHATLHIQIQPKPYV